MEEKRIEEEAHQFVDYMVMPGSSSRPLSWKSPRAKGAVWVFWTEEKVSNHASTSSDHLISIQDRIKTALLALKHYYYGGDVLVQFWAATTTMTDEGGAPRSALTTADQPFALNCLTNEKLNQYKKNCPNYKLVDQGEEEHNLTDGSICRVFRRQWPEMSPDISYYSVKEYPERDLALRCDFRSTLTLPVFEPSLRCCVGVLELLFTAYTYSMLFRLDIVEVIRVIEGAGLQTVDPWRENKYIPNITFIEKQELKGAMYQVRETHGLRLVNIWTRGSLNKSFNTSDLNFGEDFLYTIPEIEVYDKNSFGYNEFIRFTTQFPVRVGNGPVGKVFYSNKPCFCRDVTRLSIIDYPMAHFTRTLGLKSCFAVCLQSVATGNRVYALDLFLPPDYMHSGDLYNLLSSILMTLQQHLKSFEVVIGDIQNDLFTEIENLTKSKVEATTSSSGKLTSFHTLSSSNTYSGNETTSSSGQLTSFHTISSLSTSSDQDTTSSSGQLTSFHTISSSNTYSGNETTSSSGQLTSASEATLNNTFREPNIYTSQFGNKSYLDWSTSTINEHMDSETGSSSLFRLFGHTMTVSQYQVPRMNAIRGDSSLSDGPRSECSAVGPRTVPPLSTVDVEMVDVNENYEEGL